MDSDSSTRAARRAAAWAIVDEAARSAVGKGNGVITVTLTASEAEALGKIRTFTSKGWPVNLEITAKGAVYRG